MPRTPKEHATRRKDGRFQCYYNGRYFIGQDEDDVLRQRREAKARDALAIHEASRPKTVRQYAAEWLPLHRSGVGDKTYDDYARQLDALNAVCGDKLLKEVTPDDAAAVWKHYADYSTSTIKRSAQLFRALFDSAIENDYCVKNPFRAKTAKPPAGTSGTHRALTADEISLVTGTEHRFRLAAMIMLYAGLRRGEAIALTADDIDLKAGVIRVRRAVRFAGNAPILDTPKTAAGVRDVPILSALRPALQARLAAIHAEVEAREAAKDAEDVEDDQDAPPIPLVPGSSGRWMTETAFSRAWDSYLLALTRAAGHEVTIRCHDFRHTYCTMLCDAGVPMRQAMEWLGHADEKMILRVYDHNTASRRAASVRALEAAIAPPKKDGTRRRA